MQRALNHLVVASLTFLSWSLVDNDANNVSSALGALGRRFESFRADSNYPSHRQVTQPVFFII